MTEAPTRPASVTDRLILAGATAGLACALAIHVAILAGADVALSRPGSWLLHSGAVIGFWCMARRIAQARLRGVAGLLAIRRLVPVPLRVALGAATLNVLAVAASALSGRIPRDQALSAYWTMMYLLVTTIFAFVVPRVRDGEIVRAPSASAGRS